jgi:hypothetical protein
MIDIAGLEEENFVAHANANWKEGDNDVGQGYERGNRKETWEERSRGRGRR